MQYSTLHQVHSNSQANHHAPQNNRHHRHNRQPRKLSSAPLPPRPKLPHPRTNPQPLIPNSPAALRPRHRDHPRRPQQHNHPHRRIQERKPHLQRHKLLGTILQPRVPRPSLRIRYLVQAIRLRSGKAAGEEHR